MAEQTNYRGQAEAIMARARELERSEATEDADREAELMACLEEGTIRPADLPRDVLARLVSIYGAERVVEASVDGALTRSGESNDAADAREARRFPAILGTKWALGAAVAAAAIVAIFLWRLDSVVRLNDGGGTVAVHRNGVAEGLDDLPPEVRESVSAAIRSGSVSLPSDFGAAAPRSPGTLRGDAAASDEVLISPLGVVADSRPTFAWKGPATGREYSVQVFGPNDNPVTRSPWIVAREWRPEQPLPHGRLLRWQIVARANGTELLFPPPPAAEARFRVLDPAVVADLEAARRSAHGSSLVMGILYARAGLVREAREELTSLVDRNPNASLPRALRDSLPQQP